MRRPCRVEIAYGSVASYYLAAGRIRSAREVLPSRDMLGLVTGDLFFELLDLSLE